MGIFFFCICNFFYIFKLLNSYFFIYLLNIFMHRMLKVVLYIYKKITLCKDEFYIIYQNSFVYFFLCFENATDFLSVIELNWFTNNIQKWFGIVLLKYSNIAIEKFGSAIILLLFFVLFASFYSISSTFMKEL